MSVEVEVRKEKGLQLPLYFKIMQYKQVQVNQPETCVSRNCFRKIIRAWSFCVD